MQLPHKHLSEVSDMLNSYYTEKLLEIQEVEIKNIQEKEEIFEISIEQPRKTCNFPH